MNRNVQNIGVLVLAAGESSRIQPLSKGLPKPLIQIQGKSILERNLKWLSEFGIISLWINLHYGADAIRRTIGTGEKWGLSVSYSYELKLMGTAGAFKLLQKEWQGSTLIVYGDNLISFNLEKFIKAHKMSGVAGSIALFDQKVQPHTGISGGKVSLDSSGHITKFLEGKGDDVSHPMTLVNAGVYLVEQEILEWIPSDQNYDFAHDVFPKMIKSGKKLQGYVMEGYCLGLDTPESYANAISLIECGKVKLL